MFHLELKYQFDFLANNFVPENNVHTYEKYDVCPS